MKNKLYRSSSNQVISGVCGGIGEYFDIDATIIRLIWVLISLPALITSVIVYIACNMIIPEDVYKSNSDFTDKRNHSGNRAVLFGCILIILGASLLLKKIFPWFNYSWYYIKKFWPLLLVLLGIYIIYKEKHTNN